MTVYLVIKITTLKFYFSTGFKASVGVWETDGNRGSGRRRQPAILTNNFFPAVLCYLQDLTSSLPTRRTQPVFARGPLGPLAATVLYLPTRLTVASWDRLQTATASHVGICIYHFITPVHFRSTTWLLPFIFIGASCAENLWLTARSRINMQQFLFNRTSTLACYLVLSYRDKVRH